MVPVPYLNRTVVRTQQSAGYGLGRFLHLIDFRLYSPVGPYRAVGAGADAITEILTLLLLRFEVEVQQLARCVGNDDIVHQRIADIHLGVLSVGLLVAAYVHGEGCIDDVALCFHLGYLRVVDDYRHLLPVVASFHVVPLVLPVAGQLG